MRTKEYRSTPGILPDGAKPALLALSILIDRIGTLPKADREDFLEAMQEWGKANDEEDRRSLERAMEEIVAQAPVSVRPMPLAEAPPSRGLKQWSEQVGRRIRELREAVGSSQVQLAESAGLTQSHISRLENAEHSATNFTLEKIAKALGVPVSQIDPYTD